jgi:hypothetical protein
VIELLQAKKPDTGSLLTWPRRGASIAALLVDQGWDYHEWARILGGYFGGRGLTRINVLSADWPTPGGLLWPFWKRPDGQFDLYRFNPWFTDRAVAIRDAMHRQGIVVQWTFLELYSWSNRKKGPGIPDGNYGPFRYNVNGVKWGGAYNGDRKEDDATLTALPDPWLTAFCEWIVPIIGGPGTVIEIGNEFPEKPLHERMAALIHRINPAQQVSWNRQEDTPGQYPNMMKGDRYERCAFHGRLLKKVSDLDRVYTTEPDYRTFNEFFNECPHDPARIIFSSDGARSSNDPIETYDWPHLLAFAEAVIQRGCGYEHQSRMKMPGNAYDFRKVEHEFLRDLADAE